MTPTEKLQALYDSEINARLDWFWDAGFAWRLGDWRNGWQRAGAEDTLAGAVDRLWTVAKERYPNARCFK